MRSTREDRTTRAIIRDEALRLFADRGPDSVTVRQVAAAAGVSPGLVIHHFGSKDGLREAVDQHVLGLFDDMLAEMTRTPPAELYDPAASGSVAEAILRRLPDDSPVPGYLRRLLLAGGAGREVFRRLFALSSRTLDDMAAAGLAARGDDPEVRAAFLLCNDLAVLLLRDHIAAVLGTDPLSGEGLARWAGEVLAVYAAGLLPAPPGGS